ncbi:hypothetical protein [Natrinema sp. H-ect4]|uniref:hypothetical protein n=1 Tax=Natrinema sp. H-ect4 TaxID=3242699 RepID=UPI0035A84FB3
MESTYRSRTGPVWEHADEGFTGQTAAAVSGEVPPVERCLEWDEETIENTTENAEESLE